MLYSKSGAILIEIEKPVWQVLKIKHKWEYSDPGRADFRVSMLLDATNPDRRVE